jgi:AcrR family transcriptional regulator
MPKKPTTTKEAIVEAGFELVRARGHEALTARSLAAELGCSTQPIMYQFSNLSQLKELVYQRADAFHTEYILTGGSLLSIGLRYVQFAAEEPELFRFLFQSGHFDGTTLRDMIQAPEAQPLLTAFASREAGSDMTQSGADPDLVSQTFEALYVAVHGYASLIANNTMPYDPATVESTLALIGNVLLKEGEPS